MPKKSRFPKLLFAASTWLFVGAAAAAAQPILSPHQTLQPTPAVTDDEYFGQTLAAGHRRLVAADALSVFQYEWNDSTHTWVESGSPLAIPDTYSIDLDGARTAFDDGSTVIDVLGLPNTVNVPVGASIQDIAYADTTLIVSFSLNLDLPLDVYVVPLDGSPPSLAETISPPPGAVGRFGRSLALSADGQLLAVGAPGDAGETGHVYVYKRSGGSLNHLWWDTFHVELDNAFGWSTALNEAGDLLVVGAPNEDKGTGGTPDDLGAVFIYDTVSPSSNALAVFGGTSAGGRLGQSGDITKWSTVSP